MLRTVSRCGIGMLLSAAVMALLPLVPRAEADHIVPLSIAGIRPGMRPHQVRAVLGSPKRSKKRRSYGRVVEREWRYPDHLAVGFRVEPRRPQRVYRVRTKSPRDRFKKGIHVGVRRRVLHRLGGLKCVHSVGSELYPRGTVCTWYPFWVSDICGPHLEFYLRHRRGRVKYIELWGVVPIGARVAARRGC